LSSVWHETCAVGEHSLKRRREALSLSEASAFKEFLTVALTPMISESRFAEGKQRATRER
jgi:hypothetical protein